MLERASEDPECHHAQGPSCLLTSLPLGVLRIPIYSPVKKGHWEPRQAPSDC